MGEVFNLRLRVAFLVQNCGTVELYQQVTGGNFAAVGDEFGGRNAAARPGAAEDSRHAYRSPLQRLYQAGGAEDIALGRVHPAPQSAGTLKTHAKVLVCTGRGSFGMR